MDEDKLRCEHGLLRPCEECDPFVYARWQFGRLQKELPSDNLSTTEGASVSPESEN